MTAATVAVLDTRRTGTRLGNVVRSEWTKFWSLRSTMWTLLTLVTVTVGTSALIAWGQTSHLDKMSPVEVAQLDPTSMSMAGLMFGQLAIAVLGVLIVCGEYATGGIRTTFTAVPDRARVLLAKGIVFSVAAAMAGMVTAFGAYFASMPFWAHYGLATHLSDPGVLRAVLGGGLYVLASGLFGFALGVVIRHTAGAITAAVALLLVLPPLTQLLPGTWGHDVQRYFTSNAGGHVTDVVRVPGVISPWLGYLTLTIEWIVPLLLGIYLVRRRDA
jgi:ABC-2 type transport system permease protein